MNIDEIIERLVNDPACEISKRDRPITIPENLPADVREFFSKCTGGGLFYSLDYPTPQFGTDLFFSETYFKEFIEQEVVEGPEFHHMTTIALDSQEGYYDCVLVSTEPCRFGHIYRLAYALGDPFRTFSDAYFLARNFTRWLEIYIEAWEVYQQDWKAGFDCFNDLLDKEKAFMEAQKNQSAE